MTSPDEWNHEKYPLIKELGLLTYYIEDASTSCLRKISADRYVKAADLERLLEKGERGSLNGLPALFLPLPKQPDTADKEELIKFIGEVAQLIDKLPEGVRVLAKALLMREGKE